MTEGVPPAAASNDFVTPPRQTQALTPLGPESDGCRSCTWAERPRRLAGRACPIELVLVRVLVERRSVKSPARAPAPWRVLHRRSRRAYALENALDRRVPDPRLFDTPGIHPRDRDDRVSGFRQANAVLALVVGCAGALLLLASVPDAFTTGFVLRGFVLAAVAAGALIGFGMQRDGPWPTRRLSVWVALLPLAIPLLALQTAGREDVWHALRHSAPWLALAVLPLTLGRALPDPEARHRAWQVVGATAVAAAVWTLVDALSRGAAGAGPFGRPGVAGPVLAAVAGPAIVALTVRRNDTSTSRGRAIARAALAAVFVAAVVSTRSRMAVLAATLALLVAWVTTRPPGSRSRAARTAGAVAAAGFLYVALAVSGVVPLVGGRHTADVRLGLHRASFRLIGEAPWQGQGLGRYEEEVLRVRDLEEARLEANRRPTHAHDDYVHVAAEVGVPGGVALVVYVLLMLGLALRAVLRGAPSPGHGLRVACAAGMLVIAVASAGDGVLTDPAGVAAFALCAAAMWGSIARPPAPAVAQVRVRQAAWLIAPVLLACAFAHAKNVSADRAFADFVASSVDALRAGRPVDDLVRAQLVEGVLHRRSDHAQAWYQLGVYRARKGEYVAARDAFRQACRHDPGTTEARLDLATVYELQDRPQDARQALREARRWDPTRFDVALRLAHLALGPEPLAGDPLPAVDIEPVLIAYNAARALNPTRIENTLAEARLARRLGKLDECGALLRKAMQRVGGTQADAPPEVLLESFRLAEVEGAPQPSQVSILVLALRRDPRLSGLVSREAKRWIDLGEAREADAIPELRPGVARLDDTASQRAYDGATVRFAALLFAGQMHAAALLADARKDASERRPRRALCQYRALLAWSNPDTDAPADFDDPLRIKAVAQRGDLFIEAAKVAKPVDGKRARLYFDRGQALIGEELLAKGEWKHAARQLRNVVKNNPDASATRLALAHALVRDGQRDDAARELVRALLDDPTLRHEATRNIAFRTLYDRPAVRDALGLRSSD